MDLVTSIYDDSVLVILIGNGDGTFTRSTDLPVPMKPDQLVIADFDNDMKNDLAVVSRYNLLATYKGNGDGSFADPVTTPGVGLAAQDISRP